MARPKKLIIVTSQQQELLLKISKTRQSPHSLVERSKIILKSLSGLSNKKISQDLEICEETVGKWRNQMN